MFNIGDIVKLKTDLILGEKYGGLTYWGSMSYYANKPLKIISTTRGADYRVEDCGYTFSEEMLELYDKKLTNPSITHNFKIGDTVTIRKDLIPNNLYQSVAFVDCMSKYRGHTFKIESIVTTLPNTYILETSDGNQFWFTEAMFESLLNTKEFIDNTCKCIESTKYTSISEQIDESKKNINSNKITITEVIINPCKRETYTL